MQVDSRIGSRVQKMEAMENLFGAARVGRPLKKPVNTEKFAVPVRKSLLGILVKVCYTDLE